MEFIDALRQQFPMYDDKEDDVLIEAYRSKYHPNKSVADLENSYAQKLEREEERRRQRELEEQGFFGRAADLIEAGGREFVGSSAEGIATIADMIGGCLLYTSDAADE